ncbi:hypothetical protein B0H17DRAFT_1137137 [Mycena rosella]|uniref:DEAD/DEAH-box helicase domain-containing protein n=1 Tax=Mycena rosella TaxID=1033263 RepID=A0AAD7D9G1_MYCRO|nr:hypothetical protein B0H17DRAFT_1137137 [Mycena rosella]
MWGGRDGGRKERGAVCQAVPHHPVLILDVLSLAEEAALPHIKPGTVPYITSCAALLNLVGQDKYPASSARRMTRGQWMGKMWMAGKWMLYACCPCQCMRTTNGEYMDGSLQMDAVCLHGREPEARAAPGAGQRYKASGWHEMVGIGSDQTVRNYKAEEINVDLVARAHEVLCAKLFRFQLEVAAAILRGGDVIIDVGTGCGKTPCFTLPLLLNATKIAMIVSPLSALMIDQAARPSGIELIQFL